MATARIQAGMKPTTEQKIKWKLALKNFLATKPANSNKTHKEDIELTLWKVMLIGAMCENTQTISLLKNPTVQSLTNHALGLADFAGDKDNIHCQNLVKTYFREQFDTASVLAETLVKDFILTNLKLFPEEFAVFFIHAFLNKLAKESGLKGFSINEAKLSAYIHKAQNELRQRPSLHTQADIDHRKQMQEKIVEENSRLIFREALRNLLAIGISAPTMMAAYLYYPNRYTLLLFAPTKLYILYRNAELSHRAYNRQQPLISNELFARFQTECKDAILRISKDMAAVFQLAEIKVKPRPVEPTEKVQAAPLRTATTDSSSVAASAIAASAATLAVATPVATQAIAAPAASTASNTESQQRQRVQRLPFAERVAMEANAREAERLRLAEEKAARDAAKQEAKRAGRRGR